MSANKIIQIGAGSLVQRLHAGGYSISDIQREVLKQYNQDIAYNSIKNFLSKYKGIELVDTNTELDKRDMILNMGRLHYYLTNHVCSDCRQKIKDATDEFLS